MAIDYSGTTQDHRTTTTPVTAAPMTLACWFNSNVINVNDVLMAITDSVTEANYFNLRLSGGVAGDPISAIANDGAGDILASTSTGFSASVWMHACGVFASSTSRSAYIDGGSKGTSTTSVTPSGVDRISLASVAKQTPTLFLSGRLAECGIWNVALTDAEVLALARGFAPSCVQPQALVFYAPLVRDVIDVRGGLTLTATGSPTVAVHPRIIYPHKRIVNPLAPPPPPVNRIHDFNDFGRLNVESPAAVAY